MLEHVIKTNKRDLQNRVRQMVEINALYIRIYIGFWNYRCVVQLFIMRELQERYLEKKKIEKKEPTAFYCCINRKLLEVKSWKLRAFRMSLPWEPLYADDLALIAETEEQLLDTLKLLKDEMESKGLRVKTKHTCSQGDTDKVSV